MVTPFIVSSEAMDYLNHLQKGLFVALGNDGAVVLCMIVAMVAMAGLLWASRPGRTWQKSMGSMAAIVLFGVALAALDTSPVQSRWMQYASAIATPMVVWWLGREAWKAYLTPWTFLWRRIGLVMLAIGALGYLVITTTPHDTSAVLWAPYFLTLLFSPLFAFKALLWWTLTTLKRVYMGKYSYEKQSTKTVDVYFTVWWNDKIRGRKVDPGMWLSVTAAHPQFMASRWWQKKALSFWPDIMDWDAKLGTPNMLWFIQELMNNPPEVLDDYSAAKDLWSFSPSPG